MSKPGQIPYTWDEIEVQIKRNVVAMADILAVYGPYNNALLDLFLGCDTSQLLTDEITGEQFGALDVSNHGIYILAKRAYAYAYQLDGAEVVTGDDWYEATGLLERGYAQIDRHGEPAPLNERLDQPFRRMIETFYARWDLNNHGSGMSVRRLALLANMSMQAVRNSLSKEGYKLELKVSGGDDEHSFELPASDALTWLSKRRGYIPNRMGIRMDDPNIAVAETLNKGDIGFPEILDRLVTISRKSASDLASASGAPKNWIDRLLSGEPVEVDLTALVALGRELGADPAKFTGRAVEHLVAASLENTK